MTWLAAAAPRGSLVAESRRAVPREEGHARHQVKLEYASALGDYGDAAPSLIDARRRRPPGYPGRRRRRPNPRPARLASHRSMSHVAYRLPLASGRAASDWDDLLTYGYGSLVTCDSIPRTSRTSCSGRSPQGYNVAGSSRRQEADLQLASDWPLCSYCAFRPDRGGRVAVLAREATVERLAAAQAHEDHEPTVVVVRRTVAQLRRDDVDARRRDERDELALVLDGSRVGGFMPAVGRLAVEVVPPRLSDRSFGRRLGRGATR